MRVDLNSSALPELDQSRGASSASAAKTQTADVGATSGDDVARLTTGSDSINTLKAQLNAVPDVRQDRVEALKKSINEGTFEVSPARIADAMLTEENS